MVDPIIFYSHIVIATSTADTDNSNNPGIIVSTSVPNIYKYSKKRYRKYRDPHYSQKIVVLISDDKYRGSRNKFALMISDSRFLDGNSQNLSKKYKIIKIK